MTADEYHRGLKDPTFRQAKEAKVREVVMDALEKRLADLESREPLVQKVVQTQRLIDHAYLNHEPTGNLRIELRTALQDLVAWKP